MLFKLINAAHFCYVKIFANVYEVFYVSFTVDA